MARVPYEPYPTATPSGPEGDQYRPQASPSEFGGLIGGAEQRAGAETTGAGNELFQTALAVQQRHNEVSVDSAFNQLQQKNLTRLFGDPNDPNNRGYFALQGRDAMDAQAGTVAGMENDREQIANGLQNGAQRLLFEQQSRRMNMYQQESIGRHAAMQSDVWNQQVQRAGEDTNLRAIGLNAPNIAMGDPTAFLHSLADGEANAMKRVASGGPIVQENARAEFHQKAYAEAALGIASTNPPAALEFMQGNQKDFNPATFDALQDHIRIKARGVMSDAGANSAYSGAPMPATPSSLMRGPVDIHSAILGQEGSGPQSISSAGAIGPMQVMPATFQQYAKPGESITNPNDNRVVGNRIIDDLSQKYNGDPARIAVAYFSGPQNVAPAGSPTPWVQDKRDTNGVPTSQYVSGVLGRMGRGETKPYVLGDSIAEGVKTAGKFDGATQVGASPAGVLASISSPSTNVSGRSVVLSTGVSNDPTQIRVVNDQIATLKARGASDIILLGVGDRQDLAPLNGQLAQIAQQNGVKFAGPLGQTVDGVHPSSYAQLASSLGKLPGTTPATGGVPSLNNAYDRIQKWAGDDDELAQATINKINRKFMIDEKSRKDAEEGAANDIVSQAIKDPTKITPGQIADNPYLSSSRKEGLSRYVDARLKEASGGDDHTVKTYGSAFYDFYQKVNAPAGDPNRITDPSVLYSHVKPDGDLTPAGVDKLVQEIRGKNTAEGEAEATMKKQFLAYAKGQISGARDDIGIEDGPGELRYSKFLAQALPQYDAGIKSGKTAAQLLNPNNKDSLYGLIDQFRRPLADQMRDMHAATNASPGGGWWSWITGNHSAPSAPKLTPGIESGVVPQ